MAEPIPVIIDTDPGVDDALAVAMAASCAAIEVLALTSCGGNVPAALAAQNASRLARLFDDPPQVGIGRDVGANALFIHGEDGLAGQAARFAPSSAPDARSAELLIELARAHAGDLTVIATGPLTNLADAVKSDPRFAKSVHHLIWMGGAFAAPGNITAAAEFNAWHDPDAVKAVLASGVNLTIVPLDVTTAAPVGPALQERLRRAGTALGEACAVMLERYARNCRRGPEEGTIQHDAVAVALAAWPELFRIDPHHCQVQTAGGPARGMTIFDRRPRKRRARPNVRVARGIDASCFEARFLERVLTTVSRPCK